MSNVPVPHARQEADRYLGASTYDGCTAGRHERNGTNPTEGNATKPTRERRGCTKSTNYYEWFILLNTIYHLSMNLLFCIYVWYNARVSQIVHIQPTPQVLSYRVPIDDSFVSGNHLESLQKLDVYGISSSQINLVMFLQTLRML